MTGKTAMDINLPSSRKRTVHSIRRPAEETTARSAHDLRLELMDKLMERASSGAAGNVKTRIRMWKFTVTSAYFIKRFFDLLISLMMLIALLPLFAVVALCIKLGSPGPVIYKQIRVGKDGRHFPFYKFRSMYVDADRRKKEMLAANESGDGVIFKIKRDPRITGIGRLIRRTSIDELPQLLNVLFGDMSLIGPRPPLPDEVDQYSLDDRKRLHVLPGISGLWQVSGRSDIPFKQQVALDKEYIMSRSLWGDIKIMLRTIPAVLTGKGAY